MEKMEKTTVVQYVFYYMHDLTKSLASIKDECEQADFSIEHLTDDLERVRDLIDRLQSQFNVDNESLDEMKEAVNDLLYDIENHINDERFIIMDAIEIVDTFFGLY